MLRIKFHQVADLLNHFLTVSFELIAIVYIGQVRLGSLGPHTSPDFVVAEAVEVEVQSRK